MKTAALVALVGAAAAREIPLYARGAAVARREVPQEHAHQDVLNVVNPLLQQNNPLAIQDAVFGLLGNAAAAEGAPNVQNLDCLQQIVADQAFTNAKAAGDVDGQVDAILYRALERNTGAVGQASVLCNETAANPEIAAVTQHQDPASPGAAATNKQVALAAAQQIAAVGGDPTLAIGSGTFAPGQIGDPTAAGNTCDVATDNAGCIHSQNLLVPDVTVDEINAAVAGVSGAGAAGNKTAAASTAASSKTAAASTAAATTAAASASTSASGVSVQTFTGTLGGAPPPVISSAADADRPFSVDGATFVNAGAALQRSCSVQHNACATAANAGQLAGGVAQCETQQAACEAAAGVTKRWLRPSARRPLLRFRAAATTNATTSGAALDFGSCSDPAIEFADGLDGRQEASFAPVNAADFNHGSALNIGVIAGFICGQLGSACGASAAAVAACDAAQTAAASQTGQAAADAFNSALGVSA